VEDTRKTAYTYDSMGRITQEQKLVLVSDSWTVTSTVGNTYDITGNRTQVDYPNSVTLTSTYDKRNLLKTVTKGTQVTTYTYDNNGSRIGMNMPNGVNVTYTFDDAKRLTKIENIGGANIYTAEYRLDKIGQKVRIDESGTNPVRMLKYTYDNVYRLMSEYDSLGTGTTTSYVYDDVGNRISKDVNGTAYTYTVDQLNRVTAVSGGSTIAWTYDSNGNTATKITGGVTYTYSYDRENRLVDVSTTSGSIFNAVYYYLNLDANKKISCLFYQDAHLIFYRCLYKNFYLSCLQFYKV
jgi:YD repeat-containing protein